MKTSASLLECLRQSNPADAWDRFVDLFTPLLCACGRRLGLPDAEAAKLAESVLQEVQLLLVTLAIRPQGTFRAWLREVVLLQHRKYLRDRPAVMPQRAADMPTRRVGEPEGEVLEEAEYRRDLVSRALELLRSQFPAVDWQACRESVVLDRPAVEVAAELGISPAVVHVARYRVLRRLRSELAGLLD
jgi:RNA polymerase sigma-70 factor (ECF subfamily)